MVITLRSSFDDLLPGKSFLSLGADGTLTLLAPEKLIAAETRKRIAHELDVAIEVYLIKHCNAIFYGDLMSGVPEGLASKNRLIAWLNDYARDGKVRSGVITLYRLENRDHFDGGVWVARNFCLFMEYVVKKLTDPKYVGKSNALLFKKSFSDPDWFHKAAAVCGLKLLEDNYRHGAIKSTVAKSHLDLLFYVRHVAKSLSAAIGRSTKNHSVEEMKSELDGTLERFLRHTYRSFLEINHAHEEYALLEKWQPKIESTMGLVLERAALDFFERLPAALGADLEC
ncbi:hypothetical protein [Desulfofundulus sp.]|uniref:hypothetical protein n=1 Tax=Desulfofundulus sp. TaxID=2282750 RepID=UPI003C75DD78